MITFLCNNKNKQIFALKKNDQYYFQTWKLFSSTTRLFFHIKAEHYWLHSVPTLLCMACFLLSEFYHFYLVSLSIPLAYPQHTLSISIAKTLAYTLANTLAYSIVHTPSLSKLICLFLKTDRICNCLLLFTYVSIVREKSTLINTPPDL